MRNSVNPSNSPLANQFYSGISGVISYYSIEKIASQLSHIGSDENPIFANILPLTDLEVLHKSEKLEMDLKDAVPVSQGRQLKPRNVVENRAERQINQNTYRANSISNVFVRQIQPILNERPERAINNFQQAIINSNTQTQPSRSSISFSQEMNKSSVIARELSSKSKSIVGAFDENLSRPEKVSVGQLKNAQIFEAEKYSRQASIFDTKQIGDQKFRLAESAKTDKNHLSRLENTGFEARVVNVSQLNVKGQASNESELERLKKAIDKLEKLENAYPGQRKRLEGLKDYGFEIVEIGISHPIDAIELSMARPKLDREFPNEVDYLRHRAGGKLAAALLGVKNARTAGIFNEFFGGYQIKDLLNNEIGFGSDTPEGSLAVELFKYVKSNPSLYIRLIEELSRDKQPFIFYGLEHSDNFGLGISRSLRNPSDRYSLGVSRPVGTLVQRQSARYNLGVSPLPSQPSYKTLGKENANTSDREGTTRSDGRDRSQGAGGRDAGQRERNRESGHKGYGGPQ